MIKLNTARGVAILIMVRVGWSSKPYKQTVPDVHDALHG
jgi:hypothetical protein